MTAHTHTHADGARGGTGTRTPMYACYLQNYYPLFPTFMRSIFHIYLFAVLASHTEAGRHTHTHTRTQVLRLLLLAIHIS